jgi:hypothetical protein
MKIKLPLFLCVIFTFIFLNGCSGKVNNAVTFINKAQGTILVNFRGEAITIAPDNSVTVQEIPKGTYGYDTNISLPPGALGGTEQGAYKGSLILTAGTKISVLYTSTLINGAYILFATISSSDNQVTPTGP